MGEKDLKTNLTDIIVSGISSVVGVVPLAGGFLSEFVQGVIPHQREDRIVNFIIELSDRLEKMEMSIYNLKSIFSNYKYGAFTYKCLNYVVNEVYDEKIAYYKELCVNGLTNEEKELCRTERILKIFSEMDYYEILYLKIYHYAKWGSYKKLNKTMKELGEISVMPNYMIDMTNKECESETYKQITLNNLEKNGLLKIKVRNIKSNGNPQNNYEITLLGELILKKIGVINNE